MPGKSVLRDDRSPRTLRRPIWPARWRRRAPCSRTTSVSGTTSLDNYLGAAERPGTQRGDAAGLPGVQRVQLATAGSDANGQLPGSGCVYPVSVRDAAGPAGGRGPNLEGLHGGHGQQPGPRGPHLRPRAAVGRAETTDAAQIGDQYATKHNPFVYFHSIIDDQGAATRTW